MAQTETNHPVLDAEYQIMAMEANGVTATIRQDRHEAQKVIDEIEAGDLRPYSAHTVGGMCAVIVYLVDKIEELTA